MWQADAGQPAFQQSFLLANFQIKRIGGNRATFCSWGPVNSLLSNVSDNPSKSSLPFSFNFLPQMNTDAVFTFN